MDHNITVFIAAGFGVWDFFGMLSQEYLIPDMYLEVRLLVYMVRLFLVF